MNRIITVLKILILTFSSVVAMASAQSAGNDTTQSRSSTYQQLKSIDDIDIANEHSTQVQVQKQNRGKQKSHSILSPEEAELAKIFYKRNKNLVVTLDNLSQSYQLALYFLERRQYTMARDLLEKIAYGFPYTEYAERSSLLAAYAFYHSDGIDNAIATLTLFLENYYDSEYADYAAFFLAMLHYENSSKIGTSYLNDEKIRQAFLDALRFDHQGKYTAVIQRKIAILNDHILLTKLQVANYYYQEGDYISAIKRYQEILADSRSFGSKTYNRTIYYKIADCFARLTLAAEANHWRQLAKQA